MTSEIEYQCNNCGHEDWNTRAVPDVPELVDTANAKLKEQSYGIQSGQTNFGGPRGIWLECKSCYRSEVIVGSNSDEWMKVPDKTIAEIFRRYGWTGRGDKMMDQRCPECSNKNTAPDVPELVRYDLACDFDGKYHPDIIEVELGEYVRYDQAAAMLNDKDEMIMRIDRFAKKYLRHMWNAQQRAEAAEAKLEELETAWLNAEGKISELEAKLEEYEKKKSEIAGLHDYLTDKSNQVIELQKELSTLKFKLAQYEEREPDVPELVRYYAVSGGNMMEHDNGLFVHYSQAAAIIAAKDKEIDRLRKKIRQEFQLGLTTLERAEDAEANLSFVSSTITDIANELGCNPYNEEILQTIFDMKSKLAEYEGKNE